jgi:hypothetical protein
MRAALRRAAVAAGLTSDEDPWGYDESRDASLLHGVGAATGGIASAASEAARGVLDAARASRLLGALRSAGEADKVRCVRGILLASGGAGAHALLLGDCADLLCSTLGPRLVSSELFRWTAGTLAALSLRGAGTAKAVEAVIESGGDLPAPSVTTALWSAQPRVSGQQATVAAGGAGVICAGLAVHCDDARAAAAGALALRAFALRADEATLTVAGVGASASALGVVLSTHAATAPGATLQAAWALRNIASTPEGRALAAAGLAKAVPPLVAALRAAVAGGARGCDAADDSGVDALTSARAPAVFEPLARAVCNLALDVPVLRALVQEGAIRTLRAALSRFGDDAVAAEVACAALANLAMIQEVETKRGGVEVGSAAAGDVGRRAGAASATADEDSPRDADAALAVVEFAEVARALAPLLAAHADSVSVMRPATRLARNLAVDVRLRAALFANDSVPVLIDVMRRHARATAAAEVVIDCRSVLALAQDFLGPSHRVNAPVRVAPKKVWGRSGYKTEETHASFADFVSGRVSPSKAAEDAPAADAAAAAAVEAAGDDDGVGGGADGGGDGGGDNGGDDGSGDGDESGEGLEDIALLPRVPLARPDGE